MGKEQPVGIDLGTTNSAVARLDEAGRSVMVNNAEGGLLTPSIVFFGESEVIVGKDARNATTRVPGQVAEWVKRDMGEATYNRPIHGEYLPPEVIQACILRKMKSDASDVFNDDARVVITVPAYFDEPRRKATADAGEMAGLKLLDIVNEPTAAALAFGETHGYLAPGGGVKEALTVLVYDLGGGTFDVTLLKLEPGNIQMIATDGDVQLGGHDWDERIVNHVAESFLKSYGVDPRQDDIALSQIYNAVVEAKHTLTARSRASIQVEYQGKAIAVQLSRDQFADLTSDLLERTSYTTRQLLIDAKMEWKDVNRVLLVGGSTRMPMVTEMIQKLSGIAPDRTVNPDEAVARGAVLYAGYLLAKGQDGVKPSFEVSNVNSHSLGIEGIDQRTMRKINVILIPRNTALPAKFTNRFVTKMENQRSIVIQVLEGESSVPGECTAIGRTSVRNLPEGMPKGWPVEVTFEYAANGRLAVKAVVPGTHHMAKLELERAVGLTNEGIQRWKSTVDTGAGFDSFGTIAREILGSPGAITSAPGGPSSPMTPTQPQMVQPQATQPQPAAGSQPMPISSAPPAGSAPGPAPVQWAQPDAAKASTPSLPQTSGTASTPLGASPAHTGQLAQGEKSSPEGKPSFKIPPQALSIIGYVAAAIVGLGLGYLILTMIRPGLPTPW